jgi:hypothetical protein
MSEAFAYIEREYKDAKGRVELQRRVVEQLHMVDAEAGEAEAALNALSDDEASKLRILEYLRKWLGDKSMASDVGAQQPKQTTAGGQPTLKKKANKKKTTGTAPKTTQPQAQ